ncbi:hypothetical protein ACFQ60_30885 [Streptomyces zhihengii]
MTNPDAPTPSGGVTWRAAGARRLARQGLDTPAAPSPARPARCSAPMPR